MDTYLSFWDQKFVPSSDIGSVRAGRPGIQTSDGKTNFAAPAYNSRFRRVNTFLSSYSEYMQTLGSVWYFSYVLNFLVSRFHSVWLVGADLHSNPSDLSFHVVVQPTPEGRFSVALWIPDMLYLMGPFSCVAVSSQVLSTACRYIWRVLRQSQ